MKFNAVVCIIVTLFISACGNLDKKSILINNGDTKEQVLSVMGVPDDRQFRGNDEVWQYCQTGAGFGYHDYRSIWFYDGEVTAINSYKSTRPGVSCVTDIKQVNWENRPDTTIEIRQR